jgi:hypothetical protein
MDLCGLVGATFAAKGLDRWSLPIYRRGRPRKWKPVMPTHDETQAKEERDAFDLFARCARWRVKTGTVRQSVPDISCTLDNGESVTVELVSLDPAETRRRFNNVLSDSSSQRALKMLPPERRDLFFERYRGRAITVGFKGEPGTRDRTVRWRAIIDQLLQQQVGLGSLSSDGDTVKVEPIAQGPATAGPITLTLSSASSDPISWVRIHDKVQKQYRVGGRFELLAYSRYHWLDSTVPEVEIREWLRGSAFARVWILECVSKRVVHRVERPRLS